MEEISTMVLEKMKDNAKAYLNSSVKNVVMTVPAYFSDSQRTFTKDECTIVGINVLQLLNEPTAVAIAYGLHTKTYLSNNAKYYGIKKYTFDASALIIHLKGYFEVKVVGGDTHLGGQDFDNNNLFQKCMQIIKQCLVDAKMSYLDLTLTEPDNIIQCEAKNFHYFILIHFNSQLEVAMVLVRGSRRITEVQFFFYGKKLCKDINPDEVVAYNAAEISNIYRSQGITPLSLGIEVKLDSLMVLVVVPKNTHIPTRMH
eukprot:Gb_11392 [translate_table: standard]